MCEKFFNEVKVVRLKSMPDCSYDVTYILTQEAQTAYGSTNTINKCPFSLSNLALCQNWNNYYFQKKPTMLLCFLSDTWFYKGHGTNMPSSMHKNNCTWPQILPPPLRHNVASISCLILFKRYLSVHFKTSKSHFTSWRKQQQPLVAFLALQSHGGNKQQRWTTNQL